MDHVPQSYIFLIHLMDCNNLKLYEDIAIKICFTNLYDVIVPPHVSTHHDCNLALCKVER